jgi:hypothetical protein
MCFCVHPQSQVYKELVSIAMKQSSERYVRAQHFIPNVSAVEVHGPSANDIVSTFSCPPFSSALPGFVFFYWYWFIVAVFFMYGGALKDVILVRCIRSECASTVCVYRSRSECVSPVCVYWSGK